MLASASIISQDYSRTRTSTSELANSGSRKYIDLAMGSDFLFPRPSFVHGMARTLDMWGALNVYNVSRTPQEADARAMASDWHAVGDDLNTAISQAKANSPA